MSSSASISFGALLAFSKVVSTKTACVCRHIFSEILVTGVQRPIHRVKKYMHVFPLVYVYNQKNILVHTQGKTRRPYFAVSHFQPQTSKPTVSISSMFLSLFMLRIEGGK